MITLRIGWTAVELMLAGLFFYTGSIVPLAAALGLCLAALCSIPFNLRARKKLRVFLELPVNIAKGKAETGTLILENRSHVPVVRVVCRVRLENRLNGETKTMQVHTCAWARKTNRVELQLGSDCCGRLHISVEQVRLCDCFGLISIAGKAAMGKSTTVQPNTFEQHLTLLPEAGKMEDSEQYAPDRTGPDLTETFQIREYVEGDNPRQVHWKLTSKFDRLIVRDPSLPIVRSVLVFWERTGDSGTRSLIDAQAEVVATVCRTLTQQSVQYTVGWNETEQARCILQPVTDMDELIGLMPRMMSAKGMKDGVSGAELLLQALGDREWSHVIYIGEQIPEAVYQLQGLGHVTILACGAQAPAEAVCFDSSQYEAQLSELCV